MQIGIISDTHGDCSGWQKAYEEFQKLELILHAGDVLAPGPKNPILPTYNPTKLAELINTSNVPVMISCGNCDAEVDKTLIKFIIIEYVFLQLDNLRIIVCHGNNFPTEDERLRFAQKYKANILIFGHTHIPTLYEKEGIIFLNPGSPAVALSEEKYLSYATLEYHKTLHLYIKIKIKDINNNIITELKQIYKP